MMQSVVVVLSPFVRVVRLLAGDLVLAQVHAHAPVWHLGRQWEHAQVHVLLQLGLVHLQPALDHLPHVLLLLELDIYRQMLPPHGGCLLCPDAASYAVHLQLPFQMKRLIN